MRETSAWGCVLINTGLKTGGLGRGYGAFSVSESNLNQVAAHIARQEEHHRVRTFGEELREFIDRHGLHWDDEESR